MQIRLATLTDLPDIVSIYNASIASRMATADTAPVSVESKLAWYEQHDPARRPLWVILNEKNEITGWVSLNDFYGRPAYAGTAEISIYIHPAHQQKGYAQLGLEWAISACRTLNVQNLLAFVFEHNEPSLRFFSKNRFESMGLLKNIAVMDNQTYSLVLLALRVS